MKVLVADDDLGSRLVTQSVVQALGHECVTAADGEQAWRRIGELRPDVLVTDRVMPGLDGVSLCRRIREHQGDHYTYVVLLTALDDPEDVLAGMHAGADDYLTKPLVPFALQTRLLAAERVTALHADLALARAALARQVRTDPLTGLRNRVGLAADLEQLRSASHRHQRSFCVAMLDIDFFKTYNDAYGHPAGDQALRSVAASLTEQLRGGDSVYRFGGEEFLVLLPELGLREAAAAIDRVRARLRSLAIEHPGSPHDHVLTFSAGVACSHPARRVPSAQLVGEADAALYEAKRTGRGRTVRAAPAAERRRAGTNGAA